VEGWWGGRRGGRENGGRVSPVGYDRERELLRAVER